MFTFVKNIVELPGYTKLDAEDRLEKLYHLPCLWVNDVGKERTRREFGNGRLNIVRKRTFEEERFLDLRILIKQTSLSQK